MPHNPNKDHGNGKTELQGLTFFFPPTPPENEILFSHLPPKEQYWRRTPLPSFKAKDIEWFTNDSMPDPEDTITWEEARRQEIAAKEAVDIYDLDKDDNPRRIKGLEPQPKYINEYLNEYRKQELDRIVNGVWIMIRGNPVYLTGHYYKYLQWHPFDEGDYPDFNFVELKIFYHWECIKWSDKDFGRIEMMQRGRGKSARMGSVAIDEVTQHPGAHVTGQGRNDEDGFDFFRDHQVKPFQGYPDFLVPLNDHGTNPNKGFRFFAPSRRSHGSFAHRQKQMRALRSRSNYYKASEGACDKLSLRFYWCEEPGKTRASVADIYKRHQVVRYCVYRNSKKVGNMWYSTTFEEVDDGNAESYLKLWTESDPYNRNQNGMTNTGLCRYFVGALENTFFDKYGYPVIENPTDEQREYLIEKYGDVAKNGAKPYHEAERASLKHNPQDYVEYVRKFPYNVEEALMFMNANTPYNAEILGERQRILVTEKEPVAIGDIVWKDGVRDSKAEWIPNNINGHWKISYLPTPDKSIKPNQVTRDFDFNNFPRFKPLQDDKMTMGIDPYSHIHTQTGGGSNGAAVVRTKFDFHIPEEFCETPIADYLHRHEDPEDFYEDMIVGCVFFGIQALIETNKSGCMDYFYRRGYDHFVMSRPQPPDKKRAKPTPGVPSSTSFIEYYVGLTKTDVINHGHKLKHLRIVKDLIKFDPQNRTKYDSAIAHSLAVVAANKPVKPKSPPIDTTNIITQFDHSGSWGTPLN